MNTDISSHTMKGAPRVRITFNPVYYAALLAVLYASPAATQTDDKVKAGITGILESFQGGVGDWFVIAALFGLCVSILRRSFKTALGFIVVIGGIVILRISIAILF